MTAQPDWKIEKHRIINWPLEEKRKLYHLPGNYLTIDSLEPWSKTKVVKQDLLESDLEEYKKYSFNTEFHEKLSEKISIYRGEHTVRLEVDAIVSVSNTALKRLGGMNGTVHRAAGRFLQAECDSLGGCEIGHSKVTGGYNLPAKYVIHTVPPQDDNISLLRSCYETCLSYQEEYGLKSIAFPCSPYLHGSPRREAAHVALATARKFLETNEEVDRVIFCMYQQEDIDIYEALMHLYFPLQEK